MEGVLDRLAEQVGISGWEIRKRNVIKPGDVWGPGQIMDDGAGGAEAVPRRDQGCLRRGEGERQGGRARARAEELRARQRVLRAVRRRRPVPLRATAGSRCGTAGPRWARASTPSPSRSPPKNWASNPTGSTSSSTRTRELGFGQTTGSRGTLMAAGSVQAACAAAMAERLHARRRSHRRVRRRLDAEAGRSERRQPDDPFMLQLRRPTRDRRPGDRPDREDHRRARRRQGRQPDAGRGPGRRQRAHGARLRADRGIPDRPGDRLPDQHDACVRSASCVPRMSRRSRSGSSRYPSHARPTASRESARSVSSRPRRRSLPPCMLPTAGGGPCSP